MTWTMEPTLADLFAKKEAACKSSRAVFAALTVNQLNFRTRNGTHSLRWNAEHMMGRELIFFSQIYRPVDSGIPIMDLNPKQMPPDDRAAHADRTGFEEAIQMERVEAFTRRFAYLLNGMDLNKTAKGSAFLTPNALLEQMVDHYTEHTANIVRKHSKEEGFAGLALGMIAMEAMPALAPNNRLQSRYSLVAFRRCAIQSDNLMSPQSNLRFVFSKR